MKRPPGLSDATLLTLWRARVQERWGHRCAFCGDQKAPLEAHHIVPRKHRLLRFDVRNGLLLCKKCHRDAPTLKGQVQLMMRLAEREEGDYEYLVEWEGVRYADELAQQGKDDVQWRQQEKAELGGAV